MQVKNLKWILNRYTNNSALVYREVDTFADNYVKGWQGFLLCHIATDHPAISSLRLSDWLLTLTGVAMGIYGNMCREIEYMYLQFQFIYLPEKKYIYINIHTYIQ